MSRKSQQKLHEQKIRKKSPQQLKAEEDKRRALRVPLETLILSEQRQKFHVQDLENKRIEEWKKAGKEIDKQRREHSRLKKMVKIKRDSISKKAQA